LSTEPAASIEDEEAASYEGRRFGGGFTFS